MSGTHVLVSPRSRGDIEAREHGICRTRRIASVRWIERVLLRLDLLLGFFIYISITIEKPYKRNRSMVSGVADPVPRPARH